MQIDQVKSYLLSLQDEICAALTEEDGGAEFITDTWQREDGGGGCWLREVSLKKQGSIFLM